MKVMFYSLVRRPLTVMVAMDVIHAHTIRCSARICGIAVSRVSETKTADVAVAEFHPNDLNRMQNCTTSLLYLRPSPRAKDHAQNIAICLQAMVPTIITSSSEEKDHKIEH